MYLNLKLLVLGKSKVGKTCILFRYINREFPHDYIPMTFDDHQNIKFEDEVVSLSLIDSVEMDGYDKIRTFSYEDADIFVLCFSVVDRKSKDKLTDFYIPEIKNICGEKVKFIIVGTKIDLRDVDEKDDLKPISFEEGFIFAKKQGALGNYYS
jgi:Ras-related C3 botulinum toxin substrate 1